MTTPAEKLTQESREPIAKDLAEVMVHIEADRHLSARRKRDLRSSLNTVTKALGRDDLQHIVTDWRRLGKPLGAIHPAQVGLTKKRWQNVISDLRFAIRYVNGRLAKVPKARAPLGPEWSQLRDRIQEPAIYRGISRFMGYCDRERISPGAVNDHISERYLIHLQEISLSKSPKKIHRATCSMWNRAAEEVFGWPRQRLKVPNYRQPSWTLPWERFPESFRSDAESYLAWLAGKNLVTRDPPATIYKPSTLVITERELQRLASAAVLQGIPDEDIKSLDDLVSKEVVTAIATFYWVDESNSKRPYQKDLLNRLNRIARHWVHVDEEHQQWLQRLNRRWPVPQTGLTEKNRAALRQFQNADNVDLILRLPQRLVKRVRAGKLNAARAATLFQKALAIEILIVAPMRIGNLVRLRLDQHIVMPAGTRGSMHLVVPESEVKNNIPLEFELPEDCGELLKEYLLDHRRQLVHDDDPWLFPGFHGKHKYAQTLSEQLKAIIFEEAGLTLTAHQFRHLAAKLYLDRCPGDYETVRRLLGHKSLRTTTEFYTGLETLAATKQYDKEILRLRGRDRGPESHD